MAFEVNYNAGGVVDEVKKIGFITGFPQFTQPYNEMVKLEIPPYSDVYELDFATPDYETEIMAITVSCSGYGESDFYDLFVNDQQWFKNWYVSELKEGLFIGTSTFVYRTPANTKIKLLYHNISGTSKIVWLGVRLLTGQNEGGTTNA